jgi:SGNH domain (fused to AT3 domains)
MLGFGVLLAVLSWKFVETPFRKRNLGASRTSMFAFAGAGLVVVLGCGLLGLINGGFPRRFSLQSLEFANAKFDLAFKNEVTTNDISAGRLVQIGATDPALHPVVLVWGDSHAVAAMPAIDAFLKEKGLAGLAATHSDTAPVLDWYKVRFWGLGKDSVIYGDTIVSYVQTHEIPNVILVAHWGEYIDASGSDGDSSVSLNSALLATVRRLVAAGSRPWVMLEVPNHSFDIPELCPIRFTLVRRLKRYVPNQTPGTSLTRTIWT